MGVPERIRSAPQIYTQPQHQCALGAAGVGEAGQCFPTPQRFADDTAPLLDSAPHSSAGGEPGLARGLSGWVPMWQKAATGEEQEAFQKLLLGVMTVPAEGAKFRGGPFTALRSCDYLREEKRERERT